MEKSILNEPQTVVRDSDVDSGFKQVPKREEVRAIAQWYGTGGVAELIGKAQENQTVIEK